MRRRAGFAPRPTTLGVRRSAPGVHPRWKMMFLPGLPDSPLQCRYRYARRSGDPQVGWRRSNDHRDDGIRRIEGPPVNEPPHPIIRSSGHRPPRTGQGMPGTGRPSGSRRRRKAKRPALGAGARCQRGRTRIPQQCGHAIVGSRHRCRHGETSVVPVMMSGGDALPRTSARRPAHGRTRPLGRAWQAGGVRSEGQSLRKMVATAGCKMPSIGPPPRQRRD